MHCVMMPLEIETVQIGMRAPISSDSYLTLLSPLPFHSIRAVDNQLFVATCSPARDPNVKSDYMIWGHSSLTGPFGEVLAAAGHEEVTAIGEIDLSAIQSTRCKGEPPVGDAEQMRPVPIG
ncbi:omega-amidase, chloroplastic-like [Phragmites australis]|uniref:omega-amidase, chloroplastic-like n=1 Tax=Phragmites australis TaxID=29695 RepID=UPI002D79AE35|nr:omega-amidase, chloroplastic-like [Phragmites australis]